MSSTTGLRTIPEPIPGANPTPSAEPDLIRRERSALHEVRRLVAERAEAEARVESTRSGNDNTADTQYQKARLATIAQNEALDREARAADERRRREVVEAAMSGESKAKSEFGSGSRKIATDFDRAREGAKNEYARARSAAAAAFDSGQKQAAREYAEAIKPIDDMAKVADGFRARLDALAASYGKFGLDSNPPAPIRRHGDRVENLGDELFSKLSAMDAPLKLAEELFIPRSMKGKREAWIFIAVPLLLLVLALVAGLGGTVAGASVAVGLGLAFGLRTWLANLSRAQLGRLYNPLKQSLVDADMLIARGRADAEARLKEARERAAARRDDDLNRAKENHVRTISQAESSRDERLRKINEVYASRMVEVQTTQAQAMREAIESHERRMVELKAKAESSVQKLDENYATLKEQIRTRHENAWRAMAERWHAGMRRAEEEIEAINREVDGYGPAWDDPSWADRPMPSALPPVLRFGAARLDLADLPGGISADARLREGHPAAFPLPMLRPFPNGANLLIEAPPEGRAAALVALQASMFRLLTSLPPGQVRFTIVDPIGIGRGFGAFMHLVDFDPALVTNQVWTDPRQIAERLADLATHMELVTQKYLRNEYATIEEYNAVAGEVAEPYRVLVVADFPAQFDEQSAARLAAIAAGGVPCGVLTLIAADPTKPMPRDFRLDELRPSCAHLTWDGARLAWDDPDLGPLPTALDPPPTADFATRQIQKVGDSARRAKRVEVPFEFIAPAPDAWWTSDSRAGIDVPIGKAGATKRQNLALGQGTSQHVLIAGRTGSGKSTLMHAMITNLALHYSPDEIELYLIDFKKGVEFKVYATHALPHAGVVAIESEREFGLSVLQRLDAELRVRAERFREAGVQDVNGYRNAPGTPPLPRIVLIVDEFQEFFVEEDKLAQEAATLLDRLVRQGRAFGVHIQLGSQSLGGAFTLARSTLGQMGVRVALQCSEADSHLILSEKNAAAKLLSRPGEAIYNDANGATEGNHFFQVVWLSDAKREQYLEQLRDLARERPPALARTAIVFEGDAPADLASNPMLRDRLDASAWPDSPRSALAWLGDPVMIKEPTAALFRRQGGNHLLIIGQNEEGAIGVTASSLLSLAAQFPPAGSETVRAGARFFVLDGTPEDHPHAGALARLAAVLPHGVRVGDWRDAPGMLAEVAAEVRRRQSGEGDGPELFLFLHDLPRFRDLRRREDDFSFSRREDDDGPPEHLDAILRDGPGLGVHVLAWCDTVNNMNRYFTHQVLREFEMRVLFQMSPNDSAQLLDAPAASRLGPHRALFASEEQNRLEKFRPYRLPDDDWLRSAFGRLADRPGPSISS